MVANWSLEEHACLFAVVGFVPAPGNKPNSPGNANTDCKFSETMKMKGAKARFNMAGMGD